MSKPAKPPRRQADVCEICNEPRAWSTIEMVTFNIGEPFGGGRLRFSINFCGDRKACREAAHQRGADLQSGRVSIQVSGPPIPGPYTTFPRTEFL